MYNNPKMGTTPTIARARYALAMMMYLASRSPRRRVLLARLGVDFQALDVEVPELRAAGERAEDYVQRVARDKALAGVAQTPPGAIVLGADTGVVLGTQVFGKPRNGTDAAAMLRRLSGRTHEVLTAVAIISNEHEAFALSRTEVSFTELTESDISAYLASGEPMGKAGAYAIQGAAERFVHRLAGSFSGVMGLPLYETAQLVRQFGITPRFPPPAHD